MWNRRRAGGVLWTRGGRWAAVAALPLLAGTAFAQKRAVFPDESVLARESLVRVRELVAGGNTPEALRVLQDTLDRDADRVLQSEGDTDLLLCVRDRIHAMLLADPALLGKYRDVEGPRAKAMLDKKDVAGTERTRLLTPAGLEAALERSEEELRAARFESARMILQALEKHPDRTGPNASRAAALAGRISAYLPRAEVRAWAARWIKEADAAGDGKGGAGLPEPVQPPAAALVVGRSPMNAFPPAGWATFPPAAPLQSVTLDDQAGVLAEQEREGLQGKVPFAGDHWIFPTVSGDTVYVNDGVRLTAWDAATLAPVWTMTPPGAIDPKRANGDDFGSPFITGNSRTLDDAAAVTVSGGVAVAAFGVPLSGQRIGDDRIHGVDATTGQLLWSVSLPWLDSSLADAAVRGPVVIEGDTIVLAARRASPMRRVNALSMVGLDLYTGDLRWVRSVGSVGMQPWARAQSRAEGTALFRGVVYRGDEMGLLAAYDAASGRPLWVRTSSPSHVIDPQQWRQVDTSPAYEMTVPVVMPDQESLIYLEPGPEGKLVQVGLSDGRLIAKRDASAFGEPRYVLRIGDELAVVGSQRIGFVHASNWSTETPRLTAEYVKPGLVGRALVAGDRLLVPLETGIAVVDPEAPHDPEAFEIAATGNPVLARSSGEGSAEKAGAHHLLIAGASRLHTFLAWDTAQALLEKRIANRPKDARPLLTYVELLYRAGKSAQVPGMADRALSVLDARRADPDSLANRGRLFDLLLGMVRHSRTNWAGPAPTSADATTNASENLDPTVIRDPAMLEAIVQRLARCAEGPRQQVDTLLERAWLRERLGDARGAVEAYQEILLDDGLAEVDVPQTETETPSGLVRAKDTAKPEDAEAVARRVAVSSTSRGETDASGLPARMTTARHEATLKLRALIRSTGVGPYEAFEEQARAELAAAEQRPELLIRVAQRFPASTASIEAWERAGLAMKSSKKPSDARDALGQAVIAAEFSVSVGREAQRPALSRVALSLVGAMSPHDAEPARRLLRRLSGEATLSDAVTSALASLDRKAAERTGLPRIGVDVARDAQALEGWAPLEPLVRGQRGDSGDCIVMYAAAGKQLALWARSAEDSRLVPLWIRASDTKPSVVRVTIDSTLLYWPSQAGGSLERVEHVSGKSAWKSAEFATLFKGDSFLDHLLTPLDGSVRYDDLLLAMDDTTVLLVQRKGRAAAFNLADGAMLWSRQLDVSRVYDVERAGALAVISGQARLPDAGDAKPEDVKPADGKPGENAAGEKKAADVKPSAAVMSIDLRTGERRATVDPKLLGDHVRTVMAVNGAPGTPHADDVIIVSSDNLLRVNPATGTITWANDKSPAAGSVAWRIVGDGLFVIDSKLQIFRVSLTDGTHSAPFEKRHDLEFPLKMSAVDAGVALSSQRGVMVFSPEGRLLGADSIDSTSRVEPAAIGKDLFVALDHEIEIDPGGSADISNAKLFLIENPSGRLRRVERLMIHDDAEHIVLLDGKILIEAGDVTLVLDAP